jgi:hypothetical protein
MASSMKFNVLSPVKTVVISIYAAVLLSTAACGPPPPVNVAIKPCGSAMSVDHRSHAFAAILLALQMRQWNLDKIDIPNKTVLASACLRGSSHCATLRFAVLNSADIEVTESPNHPFNPELRGHVPRWMNFLRPAYTKYSCYTDDALREEVKKFGFTF